MELTYSLDESDIIALVEYRLDHSPAARQRMQRQRFGYLAGFSLLGIGSWVGGFSVILVVLFFCMAAVLFLFYPTYYAWIVRRSVRKAYQDEKMRATLGSRTLHLTDKGIEEVSSLGEVKINWDAIEKFDVTPNRTFVTVAGAPPAMVISRERVTAGDYDGWIAACKEHLSTKSSG